MRNESNAGKWSIRFRNGQWRLYDTAGNWHDTFNDLPEAHTWGTAQAITQELFEPGGLTRFLNAIKKQKTRSEN
jgi:hypothetical protein